MNEPLEMSIQSNWRKAALIAVGTVLAMFALYWPTFLSMVEIWERSETFTHGFLIIPISLWLIWGRRFQLSTIVPINDPKGLVVMGIAGFVWLLSEAGGVRVVSQYAFIALLIGSIWSLLGLQVVRALFFPLMFLFFAVPVGEFLIPPLRDFTANFTVTALQITGIPVYREGNYFSIPSGDWSVIEACSGLRYLIASITLGTLYAYLTYRSFVRRFTFTVVAMLLPLLANGLRAYMIVMIGHLSDMKYAVGVDHLIYGWVFFGVVMLLLFWIGSHWREDEAVVADDADKQAVEVHPPRLLGSYKSALPLVAAMAVIWPVYAGYLHQARVMQVPEINVQEGNGWVETVDDIGWKPHWVGADRQLRAMYKKNDNKVFLELDYYATQRQDAELVNSQNYMVSQSKFEHWINVDERMREVSISGKTYQVLQATLKSTDMAQKRLLIWQWNVIDGKIVNNDLLGKLLLAWKKISLARDDGASVMVAVPYDEDMESASQLLSAFASDMQGSIQLALGAVSRKE